jgi:hypothetical protein
MVAVIEGNGMGKLRTELMKAAGPFFPVAAAEASRREESSPECEEADMPKLTSPAKTAQMTNSL